MPQDAQATTRTNAVGVRGRDRLPGQGRFPRLRLVHVQGDHEAASLLGRNETRPVAFFLGGKREAVLSLPGFGDTMDGVFTLTAVIEFGD
jgi:hypothetical protein